MSSGIPTIMEVHTIERIQMGILSSEEILKNSVCEINNSRLSGPNSIYDDRMGTLDINKSCITCKKNQKECVGHFGHIVLNIHIIHPLYYKYVIQILKCLCFRCSSLLITQEQMEMENLLRYKKQTRFMKLMEKLEKVDVCPSCQMNQPTYVYQNFDRNIYMIFKKSSDPTKILITEREIQKIFENITDADVQRMGFEISDFHPKSLILSVIPVLPPVSRPFIITDGLTCDDDLTIQYIEIIKSNAHLAENDMNETKRQKYTQALKFRVKCLFDNSQDKSRHSNGRPLKGIKKRLTGKEGLLRNNLMGKRVDKSARTVIGPDPTLSIDEIGIPLEIASVLTYPVHVNRYNIESIKKLVGENKANFLIRRDSHHRINLRFATQRMGTRLFYGDVIHKKNGETRWIRHENDLYILEEGDRIFRNGSEIRDILYKSKKDIEIAIGDVVERKLMNGDVLLLNRQPTLHKGSMIAQKARLIPGKTIRMNLAITKTFNADFDGDEMNLHAVSNPETETEMRLLSSVENTLISNSSSKANIVIVQDSLLGAYKMTRDNREISREDFYQFMNVLTMDLGEAFQKIVDRTRWDGRLLFSLLLPEDFQYEYKNNAHPDQPVLRIRDGFLEEGAVDKSSLGSNHFSIVTLLCQEYGYERCVQFLNNVQYLSNAYVLRYGFSVGIRDCMVKKKQDIREQVFRSYTRAKHIEETTRDVNIREMYVSNVLNGARDTGMKTAKDALSSDNNFISTITSGSKGDFFNIAQISGLLGQQFMTGKRIQNVLNNQRRTLPHFPIEAEEYENDVSLRYESQGFIRSSFSYGLNPMEYWFHSVSGREGITDTAMKTATSGYIQRRMIKIAEDIQVRYDGTVRNSINSIIQFTYGNNNIDPVHLQFTKEKEPTFCNVQRLVDRLHHKKKINA